MLSSFIPALKWHCKGAVGLWRMTVLHRQIFADVSSAETALRKDVLAAHQILITTMNLLSGILGFSKSKVSHKGSLTKRFFDKREGLHLFYVSVCMYVCIQYLSRPSFRVGSNKCIQSKQLEPPEIAINNLKEAAIKSYWAQPSNSGWHTAISRTL